MIFLLLKFNFMELVNKLTANIERCRVLPLTMTVRVNPIKMVSLLTLLLYLLVATSHTESLRPIYTSPVGWEALGFFFLRLYYWAANSRAFVYWKWIDQSSDASNEDIPLWVHLETSVVKNASSYSVILQRCNHRQAPSVSLHVPLWHNHSFMPAQLDEVLDAGRCRLWLWQMCYGRASFPLYQIRSSKWACITHYTLLITYISHFLTRYFTFLLLCEIPVMLTHIQYDSSFSIYFLALGDWHVLQMDWTIAWWFFDAP